jgi:hypothetical protein
MLVIREYEHAVGAHSNRSFVFKHRAYYFTKLEMFILCGRIVFFETQKKKEMSASIHRHEIRTLLLGWDFVIKQDRN